MSDVDQAPQPATLEDVLAMLEALRDAPSAIGREARKILLKLREASYDLDTMSGLVVKGEVHRVTLDEEHAPCGCRSNLHPFTRDGWFGRAHWTTRSEARKKRARLQGHIVRRIVAYTDMEVSEP